MPNDKGLDRTQQDIQQMFRKIVAKTRRDKTPAVPTPAAPTTGMAHNMFAQDLFFKNTNILQIAAKEKVGRSEARVKQHAIRLYERYVNDRAQRIRDPFHQLRFSSQEAEGLFRMALNVPIESAAQMKAHQRMLAQHGIRHECFVDMTQNNILLEDQAAVVAKLQRGFTNWSAKLAKLPKYLQPRIEKRAMAKAAGRRELLEQLRYHSSISDGWEFMGRLENQMLEDLKHPSEERVLGIWHNFQFHDDALNRKYKFGIYRPTRSSSLSCSMEDVAGPSRMLKDDLDPVYHDAIPPEIACSPAQSVLPEFSNLPSTRSLSLSCSREDVAGTSRIHDDDHDPVYHDAMQPETACRPAQSVLPEFGIHRPTPSSSLSCSREDVAGPSRIHDDDHDPVYHDAMQPETPCSPAQSVLPEFGIHRPTPSSSLSCSREDVAGPSRIHDDDHDPVYHDAMQPETPGNPAQSVLVETEPEDNMLVTPQDHGAMTNSAERVVAEPPAVEEVPRTGSPPVTYTLEDVKQKTNVRELLTNVYSSACKIVKTWNHSHMERIIQRYYKLHRDTFRAGRLPEGLHLLSKEEQEALQNASVCTAPQQNPDVSTGTQETQEISPVQSATEPIPSRVEEPSTSSPNTTKKRTNTNLVPSRKRPIVYDSHTDSETDSPVVVQPSKRPAVYLEDSTTGLSEYIGLGSPAPTPISDTGNTQSSLRFEPSICSTQKVDDEELLADATPPMVALDESELQERNPSSPTVVNTSLSVTVVHRDELRPESPETLNLVSPETPTLIKREPDTQSNRQNCSDYEGFVEVVPLESPEIIVLDDTISLTDDELITYEPPETVSQPRTTSPTMSRINEIFRLSDQDDGSTVLEIGTPEGAVGRSSVKPSPAFRLATLHSTISERSPPHFEFLIRNVLLSFRYTPYPIHWPQCNELQENRLTAQVRLSGKVNRTVALHDRDAMKLLGLPPGGRGWRALLAALQHVGRFRYGPNEPLRPYDQLSLAEKVLQLYLDSVPASPPLEGGAVVTQIGAMQNTDNDMPSGNWRLTPFNYHLHSNMAAISSGTDRSENGNRCLTSYLAPGVAQKMKNWKAMLRRQTNAAD